MVYVVLKVHVYFHIVCWAVVGGEWGELHVSFKFERAFQDKYWLSWKRLSLEVFFGWPFDVLLGVTYTNMLVATQWTLKRAPQLNGSVWYGCLEAHWSYLRHTVFWTTFSAVVQYTKRGTYTSFQNDYEAWGWQTQVRWILMCLNRFSTYRLRPMKCTATLPSILYNRVFFFT